MARLRYVRDMSKRDKVENQGGQFPANVRGLRAIYETEPEIHAALLPRPLTPGARPEIFVQFSNVQLFLSEGRTTEIGAATVGVSCEYEGIKGFYVLAMPMENDMIVIGGREVYGEPKKVATTQFKLADNKIAASVNRHGVDFLEMRGEIGASTGPQQFLEQMFCIKALPSAARDDTFDGEVFLTLLDWKRNFTDVKTVLNPEIIMRESKFDPIIDVPVKRIVSMVFTEGGTVNSGRVLRSIPGEWIAPFINQRFDDPVDAPLEVELASDKKVAHA
ncbi:MAG TPA: acetoacetate decarboxylase family protein [Spongiibacteraceae bacterium]|nr:acetoacetate decarboxylase family protein [Spongiibacteraceae bacterium]